MSHWNAESYAVVRGIGDCGGGKECTGAFAVDAGGWQFDGWREDYCFRKYCIPSFLSSI